jgi:hypothetical protein
MATTRTKRIPPLAVQVVMVGRRRYTVQTHRTRSTFPVSVTSASTKDGAWLLTRCGGNFHCDCEGYDLKGGICSHVTAAIKADTALFPADVWPGPAEASEFDAWLDQIGDTPPDEDERYLESWETQAYTYGEGDNDGDHCER